VKQHPKQIAAYNMANEYIGLTEIKGTLHEEEIVQFFADVGHSWVKDDETAWCASFVGAMLERSGLGSTRKLNARSYIDWGEEVDLEDAKAGDVVIFSRGDPNGWQGHVAFYVSHGATKIVVLGGNQKNAVNVQPYLRNRLLSVRRMPAPAAPPKSITPKAGGGIAALVSAFLNLIGGLFRGK